LMAGIVMDRVIPLDRLVPDGILALTERRAQGKILVDPQPRAPDSARGGSRWGAQGRT
jgi:hypothetical protein